MTVIYGVLTIVIIWLSLAIIFIALNRKKAAEEAEKMKEWSQTVTFKQRNGKDHAGE